MNNNTRLRRLLVLYDSDELTPQERREIEAWLQADPAARAELENLRALQRRLEQAPTYAPDPATLQRLRSELDRNLAVAALPVSARPAYPWRWWEMLRPAWQVGIAVAMLALGMVAGRALFPLREAARPMATDLLPLLLAREPVTSGHSVFAPQIANVHMIRLDPVTNQIEIEFSTVNNVSLRGTPEDPAVRQLLAYTLREEQQTGLRLRAVKALAPAALEQDSELTAALLQLIEQDGNDGVRLKAVQVLKSMPITDRLKAVLIRTLLRDLNPAVRIAALEVLERAASAEEKIGALELAAATDSNSYVRLKATQVLAGMRGENVH